MFGDYTEKQGKWEKKVTFVDLVAHAFMLWIILAIVTVVALMKGV